MILPEGRAGAVLLLVMAQALALAGCAAQTITASLPKAPVIEGETSRLVGSPAEIYALIASGALGCWFAVHGQLKKTHIFHADAEPPSKGGAVEVAVMERDQAGPRPWGAKAFRIMLTASGSSTDIEVENLKIPDAIAGQMRADVFGWAAGGKECRLKPVEPPPVAAAEPPKKGKTKVKSAGKTKHPATK